MATTVDFRKLCDQAMARARANPRPSHWVQVSKAQYDALRTNGARFVKNIPNSNRNTMTKVISYEGYTFFVVISL